MFDFHLLHASGLFPQLMRTRGWGWGEVEVEYKAENFPFNDFTVTTFAFFSPECLKLLWVNG